MAIPTPRMLRRTLGRWLPEPLKAPFRARLFGYSPARSALAVRFADDDHGPFVRIDDRVTIRHRPEDRSDFVYHLVENGESADEMAAFVRAASSARVLFDVGAWKGIFSLLFCGLRPGNRAIAYEPSPAGVAAIEALAASNGCGAALTLRPFAVGAAAARVPGHLTSAGMLAVGADDPVGGSNGDLALVSLDEEVSSLGVVPDLVKIDVEGYEHEVILGAQRLLKDRKPVLCLELHLDVLEQRGRPAADVLGSLVALGYSFHSTTGRSLTARQICGSAHAVIRIVAR